MQIFPPLPLFSRVVVTLCVFFLTGCAASETRTVTNAFYHWQTELDLSDYEEKFYTDTAARKLYVKFFDIDLQGGQPMPQAVLISGKYKPLPNTAIVPVVFITNRTFKNLNEAQINDLAAKTFTKMHSLFAKIPNQKLTEIQFDCDWSQSTKNAYFSFLKAVEEQLPQSEMYLSATIRLHQIKYAQSTGVPPVQRGMLMYYNTGNLRDPETENSILDNKTAALYLENLSEYPKPLDLALPLFRWGVLFREGKMIRLLNDLSEDDLQDTLRFQKTDRHRFVVKENTWLAGHYVYRKDKIRLESVTAGKLRAAASRLTPLWNTDDCTLTYYHLDSTAVQHFTPEYLLEIQNVFRNEEGSRF